MLYSEIHIIITYYVICLVYSIIIFNTDKEIYKPIIVFSLPFFGFLLILIIRLRKNKNVINIFSKDVIEYKEKRGIGVETINNSVFMNVYDGLLLGDVNTRRRLILNIIKSNPEEYIGPLMVALNNEDGETSHYAASAITNMQSKFLIKLQKYGYAYKGNKENEQFLKEYALVLSTYIKGGLADHKSVLGYLSQYKEILLQLVKLNYALAEHFVELIKIELDEKNYITSLEYSLLFVQRYPELEEPYISLLRVCVESRNKKLLKENIENIKRSKVVLSPDNLTYFRYWFTTQNNLNVHDDI